MKKPETIEDKKVIIERLFKMSVFEVFEVYVGGKEVRRRVTLGEADEKIVNLLIGELIRQGKLHILNINI